MATGSAKAKHAHSKTFRFAEEVTREVRACEHVAKGAAILEVDHDEDGGWRFLCGKPHGAGVSEERVVLCLGCLVARDPSLNDTATLGLRHGARRKRANAAWTTGGLAELLIRAQVVSRGWAVQKVPGGETGEPPAYAYTIGLFENFEQPEVLVFGLDLELMASMLNTVGARVKDGLPLRAGDSLRDVLEGCEVRLREVKAAKSFETHVGYAGRFYEGKPFPLLQMIWPAKSGLFPGEAGVVAAMAKRQPLLR